RYKGPRGANDVAYFTVPDPREWDAADDKLLQELRDKPGNLFVNGRAEDLAAVDGSRFAGFTGGPGAEEGMYGHGAVRPLASLREFDQFVRGWITAGEMVAACTRAERMPILWMSVWLEGAWTRNAFFMPDSNRREPWKPELFHDDARYIPPLAPGYAAGAFLEELGRIYEVLRGQQAKLSRAGEWLAAARKNGKRIWTVAVGHAYPQILGVKENTKYPIEWGGSVSDLSRSLPADLGAGDVAIHFGYSPVIHEDLKAIAARGIKMIYHTPYGRRGLEESEQLLWLDLPWRPTDATVDIPGYSVRMLPMSSSAHTMAYFALVAELAERMGWE
ncbi:MAG TPA: hypothetical protein VIL86_02045, partial [Tepidisphaeraceae bacterium]